MDKLIGNTSPPPKPETNPFLKKPSPIENKFSHEMSKLFASPKETKDPVEMYKKSKKLDDDLDVD
jgi:hypothetical protein